ncbi:WhiB family transcriptional regulator [Streptomyces sp. WMMC1477]|uniref:WhiB family transcriptional regulator n=1 Tax=Streptomyces sp. WMMC1477 TaxID=3015155 RepID=UPI0022B6EBE7|nr:WhiB family transcriptional regulator [Streptomyces sp. WMMC1477]MCZ7430106.1 WhiB family transcriptional regulator [Streptomyces sp. WMMC1477]
MSRPGTSVPRDTDQPDPRIPFPTPAAPTACRTHPGWFSHERTTGDAAKDIERAKTACSGCPIAHACLKWALANPAHTQVGVWAGTTPRQRAGLRRRLVARLGEDWVGAVVAREEEQTRQRKAARAVATTAQQLQQRDQAMARLELELIPTRPPAPPPPRPLTAHEVAAHRHALEAALKPKAA